MKLSWPPRREAGSRAPTSAGLLLLGLVLVALNLRPAIAGFGPLLSQIQLELQVSATTLSLLTTIPLLCFGFLAPLAPVLTRRSSTETVILGGMALTALGALLRVGPSLPWILLGTVLVGAGIAVINVLLPVLVKRDFASRAGLMTGVYTLSVVGGATLASGLSVPLRTALGGSWRASLGVWAALALLGILAWLPAFLGRPTRIGAQRSAGPSVWKNPAALWVTLFMGLQALIFYTWLTWLPKLLQDHGVTLAGSGALLALGNLVQLPFTLAVPVLASKLPDQRGLVGAACALVAGGCWGCCCSPPSQRPCRWRCSARAAAAPSAWRWP